ncbi:MAG TPA: hypothetical protein VF690_01450 [Hymenobacter sp.]|jgi:hypothetical protein
MKQVFLILSLIASPFASAQAQNAVATAAPVKRTEEYCQVKADPRFNGRYVVSIGSEQQQKLVSRNLFRDAAGNVVEFSSAMDALN